MLPALADENFHGAIITGLRQRLAEIDLLRVQDLGLSGADDRTILIWAAERGRVLLSHDLSTVVRHTYDLMGEMLPAPRVIAVPDYLEIARAIEDVELLLFCSTEQDWSGGVVYIPLRR